MILEIIILSIIIELVTLLFRFGLKIKRSDVKLFYKFLGIRTHHGYFGIILLILSFFIFRELLRIIGFSLIISDMFHHLFLKIFKIR